ncbi:MAG: exosortase W, partial [Nitrospira sp.]|nr:exosortase W [Nitrospira sp.]
MKPATLSLSVMTRTVGDRRVQTLGTVLALAFLFCYADVLIGMAAQWWAISFYSYAFLIPGISAYLVWVRRDQLWAVAPRPAYVAGIGIIAIGLSALMLGRAAGIQAAQQISLLVTLPGVVLYLFGWQVLKVLAVPISFLAFMIPIWDAVTEPLHLPFQQFSADLGVRLLNLFGIPVYQNGVLIYLPNITLEVAKSCSGVNYLIAVLATSIPLATLVLENVWKRLGLVVFAVTVSALANSVRVALIGVLAYYDLSGDLHGPYHTLHGLFVSMIGYVVIFVGLWVLSRGQRPVPRVAPTGSWQLRWAAVRIPWAVVAVVLVVVGVLGSVNWSRPVALAAPQEELSLADAGWIGFAVPTSDMMPKADVRQSWVYRAPSGEEIKLSLWYFELQSQGKELISGETGRVHEGAARMVLTLGDKG